MIDILFVDDPESEFHISDTTCLENNLKVHYASGAQNGLRIARRYAPSLIISNLASEIDGTQLLSKLVQDDLTRSIPVIYVSTYEAFENQRQIMTLGADDYIASPFSEEELVSSITSRMEKQSWYKQKLMEVCQEALDAESFKSKPNDHVLVTLGNRLHLVKYEQIVCIVALKEYSKLRFTDGRNIVVRKSLKAWQEQLPPKMFLRIHRATIINASLIERIEKVKPRSYVVYLKSLNDPLEFSQRLANIMRKTFPS